MFLEIFTPDEQVFQGEVDSATFPGNNGEFQILNDHAPLVSSLGKGDIQYHYMEEKKPKKTHIKVDGGVVEVLNNRVLVLAESIVDE